MRRPTMSMMVTAFFCASGLVCSSQAFGEEAAAPAAQAVSVIAPAPAAEAPAAVAVAPATQPASMFEQAPVASKSDKLPDGQSVAVGSLGQVELHVKDADITQVLTMLGIQAQRNIIVNKNVAGMVSADLYGVDFYEALDNILHTNGYGYVERGNFIRVYTLQELKAMEEAERKLVHKVVRLNYITAADAAAFIEPLKSQAGSISMTGRAGAGFMPSLSDGGANSNAHIDTIILRDFAENVDAMAAVVKELDVRPKQVLVEASVLQARIKEENAFGVDLTILADFTIDEFTGGPLAVVDRLLSGVGAPGPSGGAGTTSVGQTATGNSGMKVGIISDSVAAFIKALDQVTDTTVVANPKLLVLNRQKANLLVGERLGYLSTTATDTSTTQTVQFLDVGTQLNIRPFVSDDGMVRMELQPRISDGETRQVGSFVIPNETTQEVTTNVMVKSGQTIVLGGLFKEDTTVSRRQVPFIGDIPVVGIAFKGQDDTVSRSEVIFLVTPTVMKDESLVAAGERAKDSMEMARIGARQALLPWSRSKLTSAHIREANKYLQDGNKEKAVWSANMALSLDPTSVEAMRVKEQAGGERASGRHDSILKDSVEQMMKAQGAGKVSEAPATQPSGDQTAAVETETLE